MNSSFLKITLLSVVFAFIFVIDHHSMVQAQKSNQPSFEDYDGLDPNDPNLQGPKGGAIANENFSDEASLNANNANINDADKSDIEDVEQDTNFARTRFTDERFAKLFPSRLHGSKIGGRFDDRRLMPKEVSKPKPTLPSFIKSTPPLIKVQLTTPPTRGINNPRQRSVVNQINNRKTTTTSTTPRPGPNVINARNRVLNQPRTNQLIGRLSTTVAPKSNQPAVSTTTIAPASRRRFQSSSSRFQRNKQEFNSNSTIPSLNPRGRN